MKSFKARIADEFPFLFSMPAIIWQILFLYIPLVIIGYYSVISNDATSWWDGFTLRYYASLFDLAYGRIILRSFTLAITTACVCLLVAYPVTYYLAIHVKRFKGLLLFFFTLPFWANFLVLVYAWFFLLERNGLINDILLRLGIISEPLYLAHNVIAVFVVMVYCYLPFMLLPLYSTLEKLDIRLLEASSDLGATRWQTFMRITLPLSLPGIRTGFLLVMVPAFGEFAIPALMGGSKLMVAGSLISYYFFVARNNGMGAAFTVMSGLMLLFFALIFLRLLATQTGERKKKL